MYYTIYQTINLINNKKYIGKHITENLDDNYLGSGILLKKAIIKHGIKNFKKEILFIFDNKLEMENKEKELITIDIVDSEEYYNISLGGQGGNIVLKPEHPLYEETRDKISLSLLNISNKISNTIKKLHKEKRVGMYGKKQSEYQKQRVRETMSNKIVLPTSINKQKETYRKTVDDPNYQHPNKGRIMKKIKCEKCSKEIPVGNMKKHMNGTKCISIDNRGTV